MSGGYVAIARADVAGFDGPMIAVWYRLNDWAQWGNGTRVVAGKAFALQRGQLVTTAAALAANLGFGRQVVRRCLTTLERLGRIATRATHRTATVITIRGYGSATSATPSHLAQPTSTPTSTPTPTTPPEALDGQPFHDVEPIGQPLDQPQGQPPCEEGKIQTSISNPPSIAPAHPHATVGEGGAESDQISDDEADLIAHAQHRLARIASGREVLSFVTAWRNARLGAPWLTPARVRADIDWLAAHPLGRRDTKSITRVLYAKQARQEYAPWDRRMLELVGHELGRGVDLDALADRLADAAPTIERDVMRAYVLNLGALYRPRAAALA